MNRLTPPTHLSARQRWSAGRLLAWTLLIGMLLVTLALVLVQLGLPPWAGFLIVAGLLILTAVITALLARKNFNEIQPPSLAMAEFEKTKAALSGAPAPDLAGGPAEGTPKVAGP